MHNVEVVLHRGAVCAAEAAAGEQDEQDDEEKSQRCGQPAPRLDIGHSPEQHAEESALQVGIRKGWSVTLHTPHMLKQVGRSTD